MATPEAQQTILVTGASGLLGSHVVSLLSRSLSNCRIIAVTRKEQYSSPGPEVEVIHGDLRDEELWIRIPNTISSVVHLAALIPWQIDQKYKASVVTDNLSPIANLIEYSRRWPSLQQIIYSSSVSVYGETAEWLNECSPTRPTSLYGAAKLSGEELLFSMSANGVRTVSLRLSSLYARDQYKGTVLPIMVSRARLGQDITIFGDGTRTQDFLHCEDAAQAILLALQNRAHGVYNIGTGTPTTMTELARTVSSVFSDRAIKIIYQPARDADPGTKLDVTKARRDLNYQPQIALECGLQMLKREIENVSE